MSKMVVTSVLIKYMICRPSLRLRLGFLKDGRVDAEIMIGETTKYCVSCSLLIGRCMKLVNFITIFNNQFSPDIEKFMRY